MININKMNKILTRSVNSLKPKNHGKNLPVSVPVYWANSDILDICHISIMTYKNDTIAIPIIINEPSASTDNATPTFSVVINTIINTKKIIIITAIEIAVIPIILPKVIMWLILTILAIANVNKKTMPVIAKITGSHHNSIPVAANENNHPKATDVDKI